MTNLRITPGDRLDVEMVRELRKCDAKFVIFAIAMLYMYGHFNHKILKLGEKITAAEAKNDLLTEDICALQDKIEEMEKKRKSKED